MNRNRFPKFCWFVLGYTSLVILWGAFVRATGSGAGCGNHWPTCKGQIVPFSPSAETLIEFTHRLSSGLLGILVVVLLVVAWRKYGPGSPIRKGIYWSAFFVVTEAAIGAGIVKFEWVAQDDSVARVITIAFHLVNTYLLLAALTFVCWCASGGATAAQRLRGKESLLLWTSAVGILIVGAGGAVTALGDTLLATGGPSPQESAVVGALVATRIHHPFTALLLSALLLLTVRETDRSGKRSLTHSLGRAIRWILAAQVACGLVNVALKAPVWIQLLHLFLADLIWVVFVLLTLAVRSQPPEASLPCEEPQRALGEA